MCGIEDPKTGSRLSLSLSEHRLAFEFIRDMIPLDDIQNGAALLALLGLELGEKFLESYRKRFFGTTGFPDNAPDDILQLILETSLRFDMINTPEDFLLLWLDISQQSYSRWSVYVRIDQALEHHRFFHTAGGYLGLGPPAALPGDLVCVLSGCTMPLVLRRVSAGYVLVGQCHVLGLMDGEGAQPVRDGRAKIMEFEVA